MIKVPGQHIARQTGILGVLLFLFTGAMAQAQNWQLVWSDEFSGTSINTSNWAFDIGTGTGGWGNNELEYYQSQNAAIVNGQLVITARHESVGGKNYTSARLKTQGLRSFKYGKIEASIAMPSFQGVWPAFWMLGTDITSVGWPACGEIDIMEHINTGNAVSGAVHWTGSNGAQADFGGGATASSSISNFHTYTIQWSPTLIQWFIDGIPYKSSSNGTTFDMAINIANNAGNTGAFQNSFFILLNMAIGGNFPGNAVDNNAFPAKMSVDYVRVYQDAGTGTGGATPTNGGSYRVINRNSGLALYPSGGSSANNTPLVQSGTVGNWIMHSLGSGQWYITNASSGRAVSVDGASQNNNAIVKIYDYSGGNQQKVTLRDSNNDKWYSLDFVHSGRAMTVLGASTANGAAIIQYYDNGGLNAQWKFQ